MTIESDGQRDPSRSPVIDLIVAEVETVRRRSLAFSAAALALSLAVFALAPTMPTSMVVLIVGVLVATLGRGLVARRIAPKGLKEAAELLRWLERREARLWHSIDGHAGPTGSPERDLARLAGRDDPAADVLRFATLYRAGDSVAFEALLAKHPSPMDAPGAATRSRRELMLGRLQGADMDVSAAVASVGMIADPTERAMQGALLAIEEAEVLQTDARGTYALLARAYRNLESAGLA
jgi:hypothetical protein